MTFNNLRKRANGRPKKDPEFKRDKHSVKLCCTEKEKRYIAENAKKFKLSQSEFCLRLVFGGELPVLFTKDIADLNMQIRRIGSNLNQMTKALNELKNGGILSVFKRKSLEDDIQSTITEYREILQHLMGIRK